MNLSMREFLGNREKVDFQWGEYFFSVQVNKLPDQGVNIHQYSCLLLPFHPIYYLCCIL